MKILDRFFNKRSTGTQQQVKVVRSIDDLIPCGYIRLSENPDVLSAVNKIADLVSNMTIHLVENTEKGDKRIINELSRKIDIEPCKYMTRKNWVYKIVRDLLLYGDGNSIVHIEIDKNTGLIKDLTPFAMSSVGYEKIDGDYAINYEGKTYKSDEVIHFKINPNPNCNYKGTGYRVALKDIAKNLTQANKTKNVFMSGKYMPSIIITVNSLAEELDTKKGREEILKKYIDESDSGGLPWVIPAEMVGVEQVKPLSLKDIAINEGVELDKKTIAGLLDVPAFFLGVGNFNKDEFHNFINTRIYGIGQVISQTLTRDLLINPNWYFKLNPRSLYSYNLTEMVTAGTQLVDRNAMRRNELRDWIGLDPDEEMEELIILENYIPSKMLGHQSKLKGGEK